MAARWGGDEFMMLLVDCEVEQLSRVLVRLEGFEVQVNGKTLPISVAAGWKASSGEIVWRNSSRLRIAGCTTTGTS